MRIGTLRRRRPDQEALREEDFIREGVEIDPESLHAFIVPIAEPLIEDTFKFSREWLRQEAARVTDLRPTNVVRQLNLPPSYVLIHRVVAAEHRRAVPAGGGGSVPRRGAALGAGLRGRRPVRRGGRTTRRVTVRGYQ